MKFVIACFTLCIQFTILFGQFSPILDSIQNSWNISVYTSYGYLTDSLNTDGDSLINGLNYKVIKSNVLDQSGNILFDHGIYGFVREDTANGKAWFRGLGIANENLFYDISLNYADSFFVPGFGGGYFSVDSVYFEGNRKIVRVDFQYLHNGFHYFNEKLLFVEGISSIYSFNPSQNDPFRQDHVLLCAYKNNQLVYLQNYQDPFYTGCNTFLLVGLDESLNTNDNFLIAPNPSHGHFAVNHILDPEESGLMELHDMNGTLLYSIPIQPGKSIQYFNLPSTISPGVYNCLFITNSFKVNRKIVIIND